MFIIVITYGPDPTANEYVGPFTRELAAIDFAKAWYSNDNWDVVTLLDPEDAG
jgi:hypothetical protein